MLIKSSGSEDGPPPPPPLHRSSRALSLLPPSFPCFLHRKAAGAGKALQRSQYSISPLSPHHPLLRPPSPPERPVRPDSLPRVSPVLDLLRRPRWTPSPASGTAPSFTSPSPSSPPSLRGPPVLRRHLRRLRRRRLRPFPEALTCPRPTLHLPRCCCRRPSRPSLAILPLRRLLLLLPVGLLVLAAEPPGAPHPSSLAYMTTSTRL